MRKRYKYFDHNGVLQEAMFKDLPPMAKAQHAKNDRNKRAKQRRKQRERAALALTLRSQDKESR